MKFYNSFNELFGACCASYDLSVFNDCSVPNRKYPRIKTFIEYFGIDDDDPTILEMGMGGARYQYYIGDAAVADMLCKQLAKEYNPGRFFTQHIKSEYRCEVLTPPIRGSLAEQNKISFDIVAPDVDYGFAFTQPNIGKAQEISTPKIWSANDIFLD